MGSDGRWRCTQLYRDAEPDAFGILICVIIPKIGTKKHKFLTFHSFIVAFITYCIFTSQKHRENGSKVALYIPDLNVAIF